MPTTTTSGNEQEKEWRMTYGALPLASRRVPRPGLLCCPLSGLVFDTFVPVLLQAGHPLWHNDPGLHAPLVGFALAPSLAFFIMTWDNLLNRWRGRWRGPS